MPPSQKRTSSASLGAAPRNNSQFVRERLGGRATALPQGPVDVLYVGDGLAAKYTAAFVMDTRKKLPEDERTNPHDPEGHLRMMMIGPHASDGVGRAYTEGRGFAGDERVNLLSRQMQFTHAVPTPIDAALLKHAPDLDDRVRANLRPFDFGEDVAQNGLTYTLRSDRRNSYSLAEFNRDMNGGEASDPVTRRTFGRYVAHCVERALDKSDRVHLAGVDGSVTKVTYDEAQELFDVTARNKTGEAFTVQARNIVLATGHHPERMPKFLEHLRASPNVHSGEDVVRFLRDLPGQAESLKGKRGLVVGSGLTMNDVAVQMHKHGVDSFHAMSRSGLTHELPIDVPQEAVDAIPELDGVLEHLHELLGLQDIRNAARETPQAEGTDFAHHFALQMKSHLEQARDVVDAYMQAYHEHESTDKSPLSIRGQEFDRERVIRALLSQYVAFRYEGLRGQPLSGMFSPSIAKSIVGHALREIDFHPAHSSWLTTSRTSTTDENIAANERMRDQGRLRAEQIEKVDELEDGRFAVKLASGKTEIYDYVVNCAGRGAEPGSPDALPDTPLMNSLLEGGLVRRDSLGLGIAMASDGRALPAPGRLEGNVPANIYPVAPALSKADLLHPQERTRSALNNTVAEAVPGLRPLAQRAADEIVLNVFGDVDLPLRARDLDYVYQRDRVDEELG